MGLKGSYNENYTHLSKKKMEKLTEEQLKEWQEMLKASKEGRLKAQCINCNVWYSKRIGTGNPWLNMCNECNDKYPIPSLGGK